MSHICQVWSRYMLSTVYSSMIDIHCFIRSSITLISIKKASCLIVFKNILSDQEANHKTLIICRLRLFVAYEDSIGNDESEENKNEGDTYTRCNLRTGKYPLSPWCFTDELGTKYDLSMDSEEYGRIFKNIIRSI